MQLQVVPVTPFQQNCSVIWCGRARAAAIVDATLICSIRENLFPLGDDVRAARRSVEHEAYVSVRAGSLDG